MKTVEAPGSTLPPSLSMAVDPVTGAQMDEKGSLLVSLPAYIKNLPIISAFSFPNAGRAKVKAAPSSHVFVCVYTPGHHSPALRGPSRCSCRLLALLTYVIYYF